MHHRPAEAKMEATNEFKNNISCKHPPKIKKTKKKIVMPLRELNTLNGGGGLNVCRHSVVFESQTCCRYPRQITVKELCRYRKNLNADNYNTLVSQSRVLGCK